MKAILIKIRQSLSTAVDECVSGKVGVDSDDAFILDELEKRILEVEKNVGLAIARENNKAHKALQV